MKLNYVSKTDYELNYQTEYSAGLDLPAYVEEGMSIILKTQEMTLVHTGVYVEIPIGYFGMLCLRSSMAAKRGLMLGNGVGIIDSDYRGEIMLCIYNTNSEDIVIEKGERIGQLLLVPYAQCDTFRVNELSSTIRGAGGFGSTGK